MSPWLKLLIFLALPGALVATHPVSGPVDLLKSELWEVTEAPYAYQVGDFLWFGSELDWRIVETGTIVEPEVVELRYFCLPSTHGYLIQIQQSAEDSDLLMRKALLEDAHLANALGESVNFTTERSLYQLGDEGNTVVVRKWIGESADRHAVERAELELVKLIRSDGIYVVAVIDQLGRRRPAPNNWNKALAEAKLDGSWRRFEHAFSSVVSLPEIPGSDEWSVRRREKLCALFEVYVALLERCDTSFKDDVDRPVTRVFPPRVAGHHFADAPPAPQEIDDPLIREVYRESIAFNRLKGDYISHQSLYREYLTQLVSYTESFTERAFRDANAREEIKAACQAVTGASLREFYGKPAEL